MGLFAMPLAAALPAIGGAGKAAAAGAGLMGAAKGIAGAVGGGIIGGAINGISTGTEAAASQRIASLIGRDKSTYAQAAQGTANARIGARTASRQMSQQAQLQKSRQDWASGENAAQRSTQLALQDMRLKSERANLVMRILAQQRAGKNTKPQPVSGIFPRIWDATSKGWDAAGSSDYWLGDGYTERRQMRNRYSPGNHLPSPYGFSGM